MNQTSLPADIKIDKSTNKPENTPIKACHFLDLDLNPNKPKMNANE